MSNRLLRSLASTTWAIHRQSFDALVTMARDDAKRAVELTESDQPVYARPRAVLARPGTYLGDTGVLVRDGVAVVRIEGALARSWDWWSDTTYEHAARELHEARTASGVRAIVLHINSPGGDVNGLIDFTEQIHAARGDKPIVAVAAGIAASAAYVIAAAADEIVITPSGEVGSVGVFASLVDWSGLFEGLGIKEYVFTSKQSPRKNPDPSTDDGAAEWQALVDAHGQVVVDRVARYRGITTDDVLANYGQGALFVGADAVTATIADRVGLLEDVVDELAISATQISTPIAARRAAGGKPMAGRKRGSSFVPAVGSRVAAVLSVGALLVEGDEAEVVDVRTGATAVAVTQGDRKLWLLADDLRPVASGADDGTDDDEDEEDTGADADTGDDEPDEPDAENGDEDNEDDEDEEDPAAARAADRFAALFPSAAALIQQRARAAERARITDIQKIGKHAPAIAAECIADPSCTVDAAARRILEGADAAGSSHLRSILDAEADLTPPAAAPRATGDAPSETNIGKEVAALVEAHGRGRKAKALN